MILIVFVLSFRSDHNNFRNFESPLRYCFDFYHHRFLNHNNFLHNGFNRNPNKFRNFVLLF